MSEPIRLSKRVAELCRCSRSEAEQYIEGGWVRVDGEVVELPQFKVLDQRIEIDPNAVLAPIEPATLLLHKPAGHETHDGGSPALSLLTAANRSGADRSTNRTLRKHLVAQTCVTHLETEASGLVVFTQDWHVKRKLVDDAALIEHEIIVDVPGPVSADALKRLNQATTLQGRSLPAARVSVNRQSPEVTGLRFALKGFEPGQIALRCAAAGLTVTAMKRLRVGRVALAGIEPGRWRYLLPHERF